MIFTPPHWATYELVTMRVLLVAMLLYRGGLPAALPFGAPSHPVGLARIIDLSFLGGSTYRTLRRGAIPAGLLYITGVLGPVGLAYLAVLTLFAVTFTNSHGAINHGMHLTVVVLVAQLSAVVAQPIVDSLGVDVEGLVLDDAARTATWWTVQAVAAAYFVSGISKLARSGFVWIAEASRLTMAMVVQTEIASQDRPRATGDVRDRRLRVATWLASHRAIAGTMFAGGLWVELLAPVALLNRLTLFVGGLALIGLHRAIGEVLLLRFKLYQLVLLIYFISPAYVIVSVLRWVGVPESVLP